MSEFIDRLEDLINLCSLEQESDTPDFILARFLESCLIAFDEAVKARENWYRSGGDK